MLPEGVFRFVVIRLGGGHFILFHKFQKRIKSALAADPDSAG